MPTTSCSPTARCSSARCRCTPPAPTREIRDATRHGFAELFRFVEQATGLGTEEIRDFFAMGMLMNVAAAMDLPQICGDDHSWAEELRSA